MESMSFLIITNCIWAIACIWVCCLMFYWRNRCTEEVKLNSTYLEENDVQRKRVKLLEDHIAAIGGTVPPTGGGYQMLTTKDRDNLKRSHEVRGSCVDSDIAEGELDALLFGGIPVDDIIPNPPSKYGCGYGAGVGADIDRSDESATESADSYESSVPDSPSYDSSPSGYSDSGSDGGGCCGGGDD